MEAVQSVEAPVTDVTETVEPVTEVTEPVDVPVADPKGAAGNKKVPPPQKFKLTIDGKSVEATEAEIESMWRAAAEGRTHADKSRLMEEQVRQFMERGRSDPGFLFEQLGIDPDSFAEQRVLAKLKEMQMSPEQKEAESLRKKLEKYEAEDKARKQKEDESKAATLRAEAEKTVDNVIAQVIEGAGKTPTARHVARVAEHLIALLQEPGVELNTDTAQKAFRAFQKDLRSEVKDLSESMSDEELIDMLGESRFNKLLKYDLQKAKKNVPEFAPKGLGVVQDKPVKRPQTFDEFIAQKLKK